MMPIYPECKFGIDDSINSIVEVILERLQKSYCCCLNILDMGYSCEAAHCNFHLRGEESDRDEAFVRDFCSALNVSLFVQHFDTAKVANEQHISIEMAARDLRYA